MAARAQRVGDGGTEAILEAQRARRIAPRAAEQPARRLHGRLRAEAAIHQAGDERRLGLRLALAAHGAVGEARAAVHEVHGRDQRVRGALAGRQAIGMAHIQREERAAVLQQHAGLAGHHAGAELVVEALDHRDGVARVVRRHDGDRVARGGWPVDPACGAPGNETPALGEPLAIEGDRHRHVHDVRIREPAVAVLERELRGLDRQVHEVGVVQRREVEALEEAEDREGREALRRRRKARGLAATIGNAQRLDPLGPVRRQVLGGQRATGGRRALRDPPAERAAIERLGAAARDLLQCRRELRLHEALSRQERRMIDPPEGGAQLGRRGGAEQVVGVRGLAPLSP